MKEFTRQVSKKSMLYLKQPWIKVAQAEISPKEKITPKPPPPVLPPPPPLTTSSSSS